MGSRYDSRRHGAHHDPKKLRRLTQDDENTFLACTRKLQGIVLAGLKGVTSQQVHHTFSKQNNCRPCWAEMPKRCASGK